MRRESFTESATRNPRRRARESLAAACRDLTTRVVDYSMTCLGRRLLQRKTPGFYALGCGTGPAALGRRHNTPNSLSSRFASERGEGRR